MKKIFSVTIIASILFVGIATLPRQAHAQVDAAANIFNSIVNFLTTGEEIWEGVGREVLHPIVIKLANKFLDKMAADTINWATGGINGEEPGFINNWDDFIKNTKYETISGAFETASLVAQNAQNVGSNTGGGTAEENYDLWQSGQIQSTRAVAGTIATFGSQQLNSDPLDSIIKGEGETLSKLLGSYGAKEQFKSDFRVGGWEGYLALADPHNYDIGLQGLVQQNLSQKTEQKTESVVQEIQAPSKFLPKTYCIEYKKDANGILTDECEKELSGTPGEIISSQLQESLGVDKDKTDNISQTLLGSLFNAVGKVADGLLHAGLAKVGNTANNTFFDHSSLDIFTQNSALNGAYQSQYDVLGIQSNVNFNGNGSEVVVVDGVVIDLSSFEPVDFQEALEFNMVMAEQEREYYEQVRSTTAKAADVVFEFDKCIPGPDYGWEQRYQDLLPIYGEDDGESQENQVGLNETRNMTQDSKVTIPGGVGMGDQIKAIFDVVKKSSTKNKIRLDELRNILSTMNFIKSEILEDFSVQKEQINTNLILFRDDWNGLSQNIQIELLGEAIDRGYYINSEYIQGENIYFITALTEDPEGTANAVLSMAWDLWESETPEQDQRELMKSFRVVEPKLSNESLISAAKTMLQQVSQSITQSYKMALDCLVFKVYALEHDRAVISNIVTNNTIDEAIFALASIIDPYDPNSNIWPPQGTIFEFFDTNTVLTDPELKTFLENEYQLQQNQGLSVMSTYIMTDPSAISQSILGFSSELEKEAYFEDYYPDEVFPYEENKNRFSIKEMYEFDRAYGQSNRLGPRGARGHLFCRNPGEFETVNAGGNHDDHGTRCWKDFYAADKLDYQLIISGINN